MSLADGISFQAASAGTGPFVFSQTRNSFLTPAQGVTLGELTNGATYSYLAQDSLSSPTQREWGRAVFTSSTSSFARTSILGSVNNGVAGSGSAINFTAAPVVSLTALASDVVGGSSGTIIVNSTAISGGTNNRLFYDNAGVMGEAIVGSGLSLSGGTLTSITSITVNSTSISGGTSGRLFYDNAGVMGEAVLGTGLTLTSGTLTAITSPGGAVNSVQFNNGGAFGGFGSWNGSNTLTLSFTGAANNMLFGLADSSFNEISFNNTFTFNNLIGIKGGGTGDSNLYYNVPTGGQHVFSIAGTPLVNMSNLGVTDVAGLAVGNNSGLGSVGGVQGLVNIGNDFTGTGPNGNFVSFLSITGHYNYGSGTGGNLFSINVSPTNTGLISHPQFMGIYSSPSQGGAANCTLVFGIELQPTVTGTFNSANTGGGIADHTDGYSEVTGVNSSANDFSSPVSLGTVTASGAGQVMTVTTADSIGFSIYPGCTVTGSGVAANTFIVGQVAGTAGGGSGATYLIWPGSQSFSGVTVTISATGVCGRLFDLTAAGSQVMRGFIRNRSGVQIYPPSWTNPGMGVMNNNAGLLVTDHSILNHGTGNIGNRGVGVWAGRPINATSNLNIWSQGQYGLNVFEGLICAALGVTTSPLVLANVCQTVNANYNNNLFQTGGNFTVTIASPAVFTQTAHGLFVGEPILLSTTGALPTGLSANTTYYVISAGLTANNFEVSTSYGGAAVNTSGSQSGTQNLNPGGVCTITAANPAVITLNNHGFAPGMPVMLQTTGTLPAPIVFGTQYYVLQSGFTLNSFQIGLAVQGVAAIDTTGGSQSGTHTVLIQPQTPAPLPVVSIGDSGLVGAQTTPACSIAQLWNTTGVVDAALLVNVTNIASGTGSKLFDLQVGGTSKYIIDTGGVVTAAASTVATLPGSPVTGMLAYVSDASSAALAWGAAIGTGGGANKYLVWYNGSQWSVYGK